MAAVDVEDLGPSARAVVDDVLRCGESTIVTKHGRPVAILLPLDAERLEDHALSTTSTLTADMRQADLDLIAGETVPLP